MADTEAFERATSLVGLVAVEMRSSGTIPEVVERLDEIVVRLPQIAAAANIDTTGLPLQVVAEAAAALRCRELTSEHAAAKLRERIERARADGQSWLVDEASPALMMAGIIRRQELHLPTGATLITSAEADESADQPVYSLDLFPGSPANGVRAVSETYTDRTEWLAAAERLRGGLSAKVEPPSHP
ncbi:MAG: hypothetical protein ABI255_02650 [Microbacteriaceae bacterium]